MDNQNPLKHRLSSMFRTSLGSCKPRTITSVDAISPINTTHRKHYQLYQLFSPKPTSSSSSSSHKPKNHSLESPQPQQPFPARPKVCGRADSVLNDPARTGNKNRHIIPESPLVQKESEVGSKGRERSEKKRSKKKKRHGFKRSGFESFDNYYDWFSSDDEEDDENDDKTTLFSSRSLSSGDYSSDSFRRKKAGHRCRRRGGSKREESEVGPVGIGLMQGKVKEGCVVVEKRSRDPYDDFTASMVEMIVEKQIFGAKDLEDLLETFLALNSDKHHRVIVEVFDEICDTLFSNWSLCEFKEN